MLHFACSTEYFPLTLTLSLREREQQASDWCLANGCWADSGRGVIERWRTILPLPKGEGRGEGEPIVADPAVQSVVARARGLFRFAHARAVRARDGVLRIDAQGVFKIDFGLVHVPLPEQNGA